MTRLRRRLVALTGLGVFAFLLAAKTGWFSTPRTWEEATGWQRIPVAERPAAEALWAEDADGAAPEVSWLGHSGFLIRWDGTTVLVDPNVSSRCTISRRVLADDIELAHLDNVDGVLVSHAHFDHFDLPSIRSLSVLHDLVVPFGAETYLDPEDRKATTVHSVRPGDALKIGSLEVIAVAAAHNGNRLHPLASAKLAVGYVLRSGDRALYYAGDTGVRNDFASIRDRYRPRAAILPIGAFAPPFPMQRYHLTPEQAVDVAEILGVETVVPCHFGTFTLSLDRPDEALPRFAHAAAERNVTWMMSTPLGDESTEVSAR